MALSEKDLVSIFIAQDAKGLAGYKPALSIYIDFIKTKYNIGELTEKQLDVVRNEVRRYRKRKVSYRNARTKIDWDALAKAASDELKIDLRFVF